MATAATQKKQKAYEDFMRMHESITGRTTKANDDERLIDSFLIDSQNYIRESANRVGSIGWKDSQDTGMKDNRAYAADLLAQRSSQVRKYLDSHRDEIDPARYQKMDSYLRNFDSDLQKIGQAFQNKEQYYSQWESEEAYNQAQENQKRERMRQSIEDTVASAIPPVAKQQYEAAKKAYDDFINSEEYRANQLQKMVNQSIEATKASGISTSYAAALQQPTSPQVDEKEKELRAARDYYKQLYDAEEDRKVMESDLAVFEKWPEEDKLKLNIAIENGMGSINMLLGGSNGMTLGKAMKGQNELEEKYGVDVVQRMMKSVSRSKNAKITEEAAALGKQTGDEHAVMGSAATVPMGLVGSIAAPVGYLSEAIRGGKGQYSTLDPNNIGNLPNVYSSAVRGQVAEGIAGDEYDEQGNKVSDGGALRQGLAYAYQGGMSLADSLARLAVGGEAGSLGLAALSSFGQTMSEASKQGATPQQAVVLAVGTAALEAATEKIPLDEMLKAAKGGAKGAMAIAGEALKQAGVEATTEEISLFGSLLLEAGVLREKSSYNQQIGAAIANGATYDEAKAQADKAIWNDALQTAAVSGFSGLFSGGGSAAVGGFRGTEAQTPTQTEQTAETVLETAVPQTQTQTQTEVAPKSMEQQIADDMANRIAGKKEPAQPETAVQVKEHISMEDYANNNSPVWRNVAYEDNTTKAAITQQIHDDMVANGNVVQVQTDVADGVDQAFPDLRGMKKAERTPILKQAFSTLKNNLRTFLNGFNGQNFEFEVNGKVLDAKLYNTGIKEVLEKVTKEKAKMLYSTESIFKNAQYLYSTPDYDGDTNVYRWNYFYTPVKIGDDVVGVRIAVRDMAKQNESQIYNWNIKKDAPLGGAGDDSNSRNPSGASSDTSTNILQQNGADVKGTGAAEANFSGKAQYQDLLTDDNVQPDRQGDVRPMEVPKTDTYGRNVSGFVANAYGAEVTPDSMANAIEELVQEGALGFDRRSNQSALNDAAKAIENSTPAAITKRITGNIANGKIRDGDIEQAMLLYAHYANKNGERAQAQASELMVDLATMAHMTGRNLQLFKLLRKLTPEGQVNTIKRTVEQNVESMIRGGKAKDGQKPQINEQLLDDYRKAAAENARAVSAEQKTESEEKMLQIQQAIFADAASQVQATFKAKWDAWRYMAMLGNGKTQIRNLVGNALFMPYKTAKDTMGAAFEKLLPQEMRTKSLTTDFELLNWAKQDSQTGRVQDALKYTGKLGDDATNAKFAEQVKVFDNKALETVRKKVEELPQKGDMFFKNHYYATSLAGFLKARGYKLADVQNGNISEAVMVEARGYAINEAMKATFNDCNAFSDAVSSVKIKDPDTAWKKAINIVGESLLPFRRTPANILVRFAEYSPVGIWKGARNMAKNVNSGKISAAAAIDQLAAGLTGSGAMLLGYFLASGIGGVKLTGGGTDEDEKRQGHQDYALEFSIDGQAYSYKIDWAAPANLPLFVGANIYKALEDAKADTSVSAFSRLLQATKHTLEPMLQLSCLSSLNDFVEGIRYAPEGEAIYNAVADIATGYFTQGIPALARQAAQAMQTNKQSTFANDADPNVRELQKLGAQIPFIGAQFQTDKRNAWGETETIENPVWRAVNAFINPGTLKQIDNSALEQEITRLGETQAENVTPPEIPKKLNYTDAEGNVHKDYRLTEEQYQKLAQVQGQTAKQILERVIQSSDYKKMTDTQKAYTVQAVYEYAQEQGKKAALPDYYSKADAWVIKTKGTDTAAFIAQGAKKQLNSVISSVVNDLSNNWEVSQTSKNDLDSIWKSYSGMRQIEKDRIMDSVSGDSKKFLQSREAGVSTEKYISIKDALDSIVAETGHSNARAVQKAETIARSHLTEDQKVALIKLEVSDAQDENIDEVKKLGYTAADYAKLYRDYEDYTSGKGKKDCTIEKWMKDYKIDYAAAEALYKVFS